MNFSGSCDGYSVLKKGVKQEGVRQAEGETRHTYTPTYRLPQEHSPPNNPMQGIADQLQRQLSFPLTIA